MKLRYIYFVSTILFVNSCTIDRSEEIFLQNFGNENFTSFANHSLFVRGYDEDKDPIVLVYDNSKRIRPCDLSYGVIINRKTKAIKSINRSHLPDSCGINEKLSKDLAVKFLEYNINYLRVDSAMNVFVDVLFKEGPPILVRFSDADKIPTKYQSWKHIEGNWYENSQE